MENFKFKTQPWEHQLKALEFLYPRNAAALYTDMGSGKTKIMLDLLVNRDFRHTLIVCTNKGCDVWAREIQKHTNISSSDVLRLYDKPVPERVTEFKNWLAEDKKSGSEGQLIVIVNYEGVWRPELLNYLLRKSVKLDCIICDESHRIKSPASKCSRALVRLGKKSPNRYLVTGTPLAENPCDVYAQYKFLEPEIFGTSFPEFKDKYQNLDVRRSTALGFPVLDKHKPYKNLDDLHEKMFSIAFRMPSSVKLPERKNYVRNFDISSKAAKVYKQVENEGVLVREKGTLEINNALTLLLRKQQITSGFVPVENDEGERKLLTLDKNRIELLQDILESLDPNEPVVVFAQFKPDLNRIRLLCEKLKRGYSELSGNEDTEADWQAGKTSVIGVQYTSGSEAVDFTRARYCIYYSLTNRLSLYLQSKKRIHRPGQTRTVYYYHLVANIDGKPCVDKQIVEAVKKKQEIINYIMEKERAGN